MSEVSPVSYDVSVRNQVYVERYKAGLVKDIQPFLRNIDEYIRKRLSGDDLTRFQRARLKTLLAGVQKYMKGQFDQYLKGFAGELREFALEQAKMEAGSLTAAVTNPDFNANVPGAAQVAAAVSSTPLTVSGPNGGMLMSGFTKEWSKRQIQSVQGAITKGVFEGKTNNEIIQSIRGTAARKRKDGILGQTYRQTEAMVRTAVQHTSSVSRMVTANENKDLTRSYKWLSVLDKRTSEICQALSGQVFKYGEGPLPPAHINCRSTIVFELDETYDFLSEGRTQSSVNGYVSGDETYYSWLKKQPVAFQNDAIGPTYAKLLRNGGMSADEFARLRLDKNFKPLTLAEMETKSPTLFKNAGVELNPSTGMPVDS